MLLAWQWCVLLVPMAAAQAVGPIGGWPEMTQAQLVATLTERTLSANVLVDQLLLAGVHLNTLLFEPYGYEQLVVGNVTELLSHGFLALLMDVYLHEPSGTWQMCPYAYNLLQDMAAVQRFGNSTRCQPLFTLTLVLNAINLHLLATNTNFEATLVQLLFRLKPVGGALASVNYNATYLMGLGGQSSLPAVLLQGLRYLYLTRLNGTMPTFYEFIYSNFQRVVPLVDAVELPANSSAVADALLSFYSLGSRSLQAYSASAAFNESAAGIQSESQLGFRSMVDSNSEPFTPTRFAATLRLGRTAILNHTILPSLDTVADTFANYLMWGWLPIVVMGTGTDLAYQNYTVPQDAPNRCAVATSTGWMPKLCLDEFPVACANATSQYSWALGNRLTLYGHADEVCPPGFVFDCPRNALAQAALLEMLASSGESAVWVDLNLLLVANCWVTGGENAECPYTRVVSLRNFVGMILASSVVLVVLLVVMVLLRLRHIPVQGNKRYWRREAAAASKESIEGVPS